MAARAGGLVLLFLGYLLMTEASLLDPPKATRTLMEEKTNLLSNLMANYDKRVLPQLNESQPINFYLGIQLLNLLDLSEHEEVLETSLYIQQMWKDFRLSWDPSRQKMIHFLHIPVSELWQPDLSIFNNADIGMNQMNTLAVVFSDGHVFYSPRARIRTHCTLDLTSFPFDTQTCSIKFGSFTYDNKVLNVSLMHANDSFDLSDFTTNKEWTITDRSVKVVTTRYECCPEVYQHLQFAMMLKRNPVYYSHVFLLPAVIVALLVPFQFLLPPDSKERLTIGSALLLACILLLTMLQGYLPDAHPTLPYLAQYYCLTLIWVAISLVCSSWVINIHHRGPRKSKVPRVIREIFLKTLKKLVCLSSDSYYPLDDTETISLGGLEKTIIATENTKTDGSKLEKDVDEILKHLNTLVVRNAALESRRNVTSEWYQVAQVFDRILCFVSMVIFVIYTCILLK